MIFCDNCGDKEREGEDFRAFAELPYNVDSANRGESGIVCESCDSQLRDRADRR